MLIGRPAAVLVVVLMAPAVASAQSGAPPAENPPVAQAMPPAADGERSAEATQIPRGALPNQTQPFPELFSGLGRDFRGLAKSEHLWMAGIGAAGAFASNSLDHRIAGSDWGRGTARAALQPGKVVGGAIVQSASAIGAYALGRATGNVRLTRLGAELTRAQIVSQTLTHAIKFTTQRTRPDGTSLSFPSGHTAATFATATVVQREFGWKAGAPAYALATWVAASRMQQERHYLSDVIAGATLGIIAGRAVTVGRGDTRFAVSPMIVPGGAGVSFDLLR